MHEMNEKQRADFIKNTGIASAAAFALLAFGFNSDSSDNVSLLSTFALAGLAGYQVVWGVAPALHSPLMAGELIMILPMYMINFTLTTDNYFTYSPSLHSHKCNFWNDSTWWNALARAWK